MASIEYRNIISANVMVFQTRAQQVKHLTLRMT